MESNHAKDRKVGKGISNCSVRVNANAANRNQLSVYGNGSASQVGVTGRRGRD